MLVEIVEHAIERPRSTHGIALRSLIEPTALLGGWTPAERAEGLWQLIQEGVRDRDVGPAGSRRRHALQAALRLPDPDVREPWRSSLSQRFEQMKILPVFNHPTSTQPMEMAWSMAVRLLARYLEDRFDALGTAADWDRYRPATGGLPGGYGALGRPDTGFRQPSKGAQPIFVNLFVTTVFMRRQAVYRRITERLVTAQADSVEYYTARGFTGKQTDRTHVPVHALWGCHAEFVQSSHPRRPPVTRLWFPAPLHRGEQVHFASEVVDENITAERDWIDVDIDHHGIAHGKLLYGGMLPISGLTIRVRFDEGHRPNAVWWYAEMNERERLDRPLPGDRRLLVINGNDVQHTFEQACQPRESYGLSFAWPDD